MHKHKLHIMFALLLASMLFACGGDPTSGSTGTGGSNTTATTGAGGAGGSVSAPLSIVVPDYTLQPGEQKRHLCFSTITPDAVTIVTKLSVLYGEGVHHAVVWSVTPGSDEKDGVWDCPELAKDSWFPLYVGGKASTPLTMPAGVGIHIQPKTKIVVQLHLLNVNTTPLTGHAEIVFETSSDKTLATAGAYGFDNRKIVLPAHSMDQHVTMTCAYPKKTHVFSIFGHLHQHGTHVEVAKGATIGAGDVYSAPWLYDDQPVVPVDFDLAPGDQITTDCTYDNPGDADVTYGTSVTQEMCSVVIYVTPWTGYGGCVNGLSL